MLGKVFPFIKWFKDYDLGALKADGIAGLTVALVLIPQSMAYAQLAGLPAYYGLYASFLPPMLAALFGSSRQLATGPVAVVSLMTAASLEPLATAGSEGYIAYAIVLALMVGLFQLSLGILRLGLVVNFLSHPVVNGFTNAAAIIIATSQLSKMFGVSVDTATHHYETIWRVIEEAAHYIHWPTLLMGVFAFAIMYGLKILAPRVPNVLVAVVLTTLISWGTGFEHNQTVPATAIVSSKVQNLIAQFNEATQGIAALAEERTEINRILAEAGQSHDAEGTIDARHDVDVVQVRMQRFKDQAQAARQELRHLIFGAVVQNDGSLVFYPEEDLPADAETDGRRWHIRVGNAALAMVGIVMKGGGSVVGGIPKGLPAFSIPKLEWGAIMHLFPFAAIISLLGFMEAISIAKAMAGKTGQRLDPNQELIGQGVANLIGALSKSYPISGSFSRSAVNLQAGAATGLSSVFTGLTVVIALLFFTPLLYHLPQSVLAAVIMMAVIGLLNISGFIHAWHAKWYDGLISIISFAATLAFAPHLDKGIMIGVVLSLGVFLYKSMRPKVVSLARASDDALRCVSTHGLKECEHVAMVRFDGPLFFANSSYLEDKMMEIMRAKPGLKHIILVSNGINDIDASGEETLSLLIDRIRSAGVDISLSGVNEEVMKVFRRTHLPEKVGEDHIFPTMEKAITAVHPESHRLSTEQACPLLTVCQLVEN
jgi:anti-anti-sigma factor